MTTAFCIRLAKIVGLSLFAAALFSAPKFYSSQVNATEFPFSGIGGAMFPPGQDMRFGSYLAGRIAKAEKDDEAAARFFREALQNDPANRAILEEAFQLSLLSGEREEARGLAERIAAVDPNYSLARILLGLEAFAAGDNDAARKHFKAVGKEPMNELASTLALAWIEAAAGRDQEAVKILGRLSKAEWSVHFEQYHTALVSDIVGRSKTSRPAFQFAAKRSPRNVRLAEAYARHAMHYGDRALAEKLLSPFVSRATPHPLAKDLLEAIQRGEKPSLIATDARQGMGEAFYNIGEALIGDNNGPDAAIAYLRFALIVNPDLVVARYTLAEVYESVKSYESALGAFALVPESSSLWMSGQIRKSLILATLERDDEAVAILRDLLDRDPNNVSALQTLGALLRNAKNYDEAIALYTRAIDQVPSPDKRHWALFYHRGIAYERSKQWPKAEADFRRALALDGDQSAVMNYLGYSWVDQNVNIKEAFLLIKRAVALKPNDGYFVDSLGWAYYRQRNYLKAVRYLENAVELRPEDPVINDHLGDAFWRVGRRREAVYQWSLALTLNPDREDEPLIRRKLAFAKSGDNAAMTAFLNNDWAEPVSRAQRAFARALARNFPSAVN